jgi:Spy/CpxP family protein refolding chaperone
MKKITKQLARCLVFAGLFASCIFLPSAQAQIGGLKARQIRKAERQIANAPEQSQDKAPTPINEATPQVNRPQNLQPANPRLQAVVLDRFLPRLDLTEEQRKQIQIARVQHIRRLRTLFDLERAHSRAYDEALFDLSLDTREIEKRTAQLAEVRTDMLNTQAKLFLELRRLLTPEQFTKLRQLMEEERALKRNAQ